MKPGIVAYIVRPWQIDNDIGRPVTVLCRGLRGQSVVMRDGRVSRCEGIGDSRAWLCDANDSGFPCFIAEECLRPLGGDCAGGEEQTICTRAKEITRT